MSPLPPQSDELTRAYARYDAVVASLVSVARPKLQVAERDLMPVPAGTKLFKIGGNYFLDPTGNNGFSLVAYPRETWWMYSLEQMTPIDPLLIERMASERRFIVAVD